MATYKTKCGLYFQTNTGGCSYYLGESWGEDYGKETTWCPKHKQVECAYHKEFKERFERFTPEVKNSTTGQSLAYMLKVKANIEPGNTPSAFTVTDKDGNQVSLSDYKGKYLLLYHWGVCPGTIWVHPRLLDLYEKYHDKGFEVLGFTKQEEELPASFRKDKVTASLFNQPWRTVYTTQESNKFIADDYYFAGVPILMLISPEGKTIYRGYTDVYEPLKKLLEENL